MTAMGAGRRREGESGNAAMPTSNGYHYKPGADQGAVMR
jgi:hypothetical protein